MYVYILAIICTASSFTLHGSKPTLHTETNHLIFFQIDGVNAEEILAIIYNNYQSFILLSKNPDNFLETLCKLSEHTSLDKLPHSTHQLCLNSNQYFHRIEWADLLFHFHA
jgi:hypothetical protein